MARPLRRIRDYTNTIDTTHLNDKYEVLLFKGHLGVDYFVLTFASASIATFGFMMNSTSVIIGAMVISPLL